VSEYRVDFVDSMRSSILYKENGSRLDNCSCRSAPTYNSITPGIEKNIGKDKEEKSTNAYIAKYETYR
jgi:hypothetical protein